MRTAIQLIEELAIARNKEDAAAEDKKRAEVQAMLAERAEFWKPVLDILQELVNSGGIASLVPDKPRCEIYFTVYGQNDAYYLSRRQKSVEIIRGHKKLQVLHAPTMEELIPGLISLLADIVRKH
jgi:hypothetical protein